MNLKELVEIHGKVWCKEYVGDMISRFQTVNILCSRGAWQSVEIVLLHGRGMSECVLLFHACILGWCIHSLQCTAQLQNNDPIESGSTTVIEKLPGMRPQKSWGPICHSFVSKQVTFSGSMSLLVSTSHKSTSGTFPVSAKVYSFMRCLSYITLTIFSSKMIL